MTQETDDAQFADDSSSVKPPRVWGRARINKAEELLVRKAIRLASDRRFSRRPIENLCGYVVNGSHVEKLIAINSLGRIKAEGALATLFEVLEHCNSRLKGKVTSFEFVCEPRSEYPIGAEICEALARFDSEETHKELVRICNEPGNIHLRFSAIVATGYECNWHDEELILHYLQPERAIKLRVAALWAIFETGGFRLRKYKPLVLSMLSDPSPAVVIAAIDILRLQLNHDGFYDVVEPLLEDKRYCRLVRQTVARYVSNYLFED